MLTVLLNKLSMIDRTWLCYKKSLTNNSIFYGNNLFWLFKMLTVHMLTRSYSVWAILFVYTIWYILSFGWLICLFVDLIYFFPSSLCENRIPKLNIQREQTWKQFWTKTIYRYCNNVSKETNQWVVFTYPHKCPDIFRQNKYSKIAILCIETSMFIVIIVINVSLIFRLYPKLLSVKSAFFFFQWWRHLTAFRIERVLLWVLSVVTEDAFLQMDWFYKWNEYIFFKILIYKLSEELS